MDGITATALLILVLQELEVPVEYHIPSRFADGYGPQSDVLEELPPEAQPGGYCRLRYEFFCRNGTGGKSA